MLQARPMNYRLGKNLAGDMLFKWRWKCNLTKYDTKIGRGAMQEKRLECFKSPRNIWKVGYFQHIAESIFGSEEEENSYKTWASV